MDTFVARQPIFNRQLQVCADELPAGPLGMPGRKLGLFLVAWADDVVRS